LSKKGAHMSVPEKMPCYSFDLSIYISGCILRCMFGIKEMCYVIWNQHERMPNRINFLKRNHDLLESTKFTSVLINELLEDGDKWFRFFSSGDFPDIESMHKIMDVCKAIDIDTKKFWIPTSRDDILWTYLTAGNKIPDNVCIRYSSPNPTFPELPELKELFEKNGVCYSATTMNKSEATCPASINHSSCGTCRRCWDKNIKLIVYLMHNNTAVARARDFIKGLLHFGDGAVVP